MQVIVQSQWLSTTRKIIKLAFGLCVKDMAFCPLIQQPHHSAPGMNKKNTDIVVKQP
ncbi:hypothetical protein ATN83_0418 [Raoultella ornithinolytica]|nr:hypothetical protein ATN83_0418 [Raoultella ornithinolytica]